MNTHDYLVTAHHDDLMRSAALYRHAAQTLPPRAPRSEPMRTAPVRLLARIRAWRVRPVSSDVPA